MMNTPPTQNANSLEQIEEVLRDCGVTPDLLSATEKRALDEDGYCMFYDVMDPAWLAELQDTFDKIYEREGAGAGLEVHQEKGTRRISDLINKGACYDRVWLHPKVLAATYHVLKRDFKVLSINGRDAIKGEGLQDLHIDAEPRSDDAQPFALINALWIIDDFTPENGATRIVPGSHRWKGKPSDAMKSTRDPHPQQKLIVAPAGSVAVTNGHLWHGGTVNVSGARRRVYHSAYIGREIPQFQINQREYVRKQTYDRISPAARYLLDV
jgi:ectoine hydroxylase-related dioxygenase (phytanoyl-CoA dioxygenase family)